jgi:hypothetical protein
VRRVSRLSILIAANHLPAMICPGFRVEVLSRMSVPAARSPARERMVSSTAAAMAKPPSR